jgi:Uma2 family endonuclease
MALPDDGHNYELIDGYLVERNVGTLSSYIAGQILASIIDFNRDRKIGWPFDSETVYQCFGSGHTGRKMDCSFVRRGRLPGERIPDGHMTIPPDLAVEVVSPNDLAYKVEAKISLYRRAGIKLVWVVYPEDRGIFVVRADRTSTHLTADDEIQGENILPGYKAKVGDFFPPPENVQSTRKPAKKSRRS